MGEIIVKVPDNIKREIHNIDEAIELLEQIRKKEKQKKALEFILKNAGKLKEEDIPPEKDIYYAKRLKSNESIFIIKEECPNNCVNNTIT